MRSQIMYAESLLLYIVRYELAKQYASARSEAVWLRFKDRADTFITEYDKAHRKPQKCSGDLLCQSEGVRHRAECIGKTLPFDIYAKGLGDIS
jgi:hypothetical protein